MRRRTMIAICGLVISPSVTRSSQGVTLTTMRKKKTTMKAGATRWRK